MSKILKAPLFVAALLVLSCLPALASSTVYNGFSNTTGLTLAGDATTTTTVDGTVLRLTSANIGQSGAVYTTTPVTLGSGATFSTQFQFRFTNPGGIDPADGITFVLSNGAAGLGTGGGDLGYGGASVNSIAIEFDTFENGGADSSSNHVAIDTNGNVNDLNLVNPYGVANCVGTSPGTGCMSDGDLWTVLIQYDGTDLSLWVTDPAEGTTDQIYNGLPINISSYLGTPNATLGFTGGTGSGYENQDIVDWTYSNTATLPSTSAVPEPSSLLMLGSGLAAVAAALRRRLFN